VTCGELLEGCAVGQEALKAGPDTVLEPKRGPGTSDTFNLV